MDVIPRVEDRGRHGAAESEFVWCTYQSNVHAGDVRRPVAGCLEVFA